MRKGQAGLGIAAGGFFGIMISVMLWIAFAQTFGPVTDATADARSVQQLDCDNSSISVGTKATCVAVDYGPFGWAAVIITMVLATAGGFIGSRIKRD